MSLTKSLWVGRAFKHIPTNSDIALWHENCPVVKLASDAPASSYDDTPEKDWKRTDWLNSFGAGWRK